MEYFTLSFEQIMTGVIISIVVGAAVAMMVRVILDMFEE